MNPPRERSEHVERGHENRENGDCMSHRNKVVLDQHVEAPVIVLGDSRHATNAEGADPQYCQDADEQRVDDSRLASRCYSPADRYHYRCHQAKVRKTPEPPSGDNACSITLVIRTSEPARGRYKVRQCSSRYVEKKSQYLLGLGFGNPIWA